MIKIAHIYSFPYAWFQVSGFRCQRLCSSFLTPVTWKKIWNKNGIKILSVYTTIFTTQVLILVQACSTNAKG